MRKKKQMTMEQKIERKKRRKRMVRRVFLSLTLLGLSFMLFLAVYILRLDAWHEFDSNKILGAPQALLVYDKQGEQVSCLSALETRISIPLEQVPAHVKNAFISAEDARFYDHFGVDLIRIAGAVWEDIKAGGYVQGASTISQQLVKLSHLTNDKVMSRKLEEAVLSYQMEQKFSKDEILEMYLNYVYFGGGFYGIEAAAQGYFGVPAEKLSVAQGAMLAGILKSPTNYAPHLDMEKSTRRRNLVLQLMNDYGYIDEAQMKSAQAEEVVLTNSLQKNKRGYYVDTALGQACSILNVPMDELLNGGYRIYTAMDQELQAHCEEIMKQAEFFPEEAADTEAAIIIVDVETGEVPVLMGGRESTTALGFNRAISIRRQPGSVIKPIISYAPALEYDGYTTVSMLLDEPTDFNGYSPSNFGNKYKGWVTMREAVAQSLNIPAVKVLSNIGVDQAKAFAGQLGIQFDEQDTSLTLALGGFTYGVSPYQIAGAYAAFASGGEYSTPCLITRITDQNGETLYAYQPEKKRVMSEANAYILTDMLKSAIEVGTGKRLGKLGIELAGKTGTTGEGDGNRDAWMAAYNPEYAAVVWMGYDDSEGGRALPASATGGSYPALILSDLFEYMYQEKAAPVFAMPEHVVEVRLDSYSLSKNHIAVQANALTPSDAVVREVFVAGTEPSDVSDYWIVPSPPTVFTVALENEYPVISFQPDKDFILYRLYREDSNGISRQIGEWSGTKEAIRHVDMQVRYGETYSYYVIPAHPQLQIAGRQVLGPASRKLQITIPANPFIAIG